MMKKILNLLFIVVVSIFIFSCGKKDKNSVENYPQKPIEVVVGFGAGGETDSLARLVFQYAEKYIGQKFVIINKPGASGEIAWTEVANKTPDGYTIAFINPPTFVSHPVQRANTKYKIDDYDIICNMVMDPACIVVKSDSSINSIEDLYKLAKEKRVSIGYSGPGTSEALSLRQMDEIMNQKLEKIPYDGSASSIVALLGGHIDAAILYVSGAINYTNDGSLKVIGVASHERVNEYPEAKTFEEQGINVYNVAYRGIAVPKGTPSEIIKKIDESLKSALKDPEFLKRAKEMKVPVYYLNSEEFTKVIYEIEENLKKETAKGEW